MSTEKLLQLKCTSIASGILSERAWRHHHCRHGNDCRWSDQKKNSQRLLSAAPVSFSLSFFYEKFTYVNGAISAATSIWPRDYPARNGTKTDQLPLPRTKGQHFCSISILDSTGTQSQKVKGNNDDGDDYRCCCQQIPSTGQMRLPGTQCQWREKFKDFFASSSRKGKSFAFKRGKMQK